MRNRVSRQRRKRWRRGESKSIGQGAWQPGAKQLWRSCSATTPSRLVSRTLHLQQRHTPNPLSIGHIPSRCTYFSLSTHECSLSLLSLLTPPRFHALEQQWTMSRSRVLHAFHYHSRRSCGSSIPISSTLTTLPLSSRCSLMRCQPIVIYKV